MPTFLEEFEAEFGLPSDRWCVEQWKHVALSGCKAADLLEAEVRQGDALIQQALSMLENEQAKNLRLKEMLDDAAVMTLSRRGGRPRKPQTLARLLTQKRKPGRPEKVLVPELGFTVTDDAAELHRRVEQIKSELNIKKDTDALQVFHKSVKSALERERLVGADAKLLSRHRKRIAKS